MTLFGDLQLRTLRALLSTLALSEQEPDATELADGYLDFVVLRLDTPWGHGTTFYAEPPFVLPDHPGHGWQDPRSPVLAVVDLLDQLDRWARELGADTFAALDLAGRTAIVTAIAGPRVVPAAAHEPTDPAESGPVAADSAVARWAQTLALVQRNLLRAILAERSTPRDEGAAPGADRSGTVGAPR